MVFCIAEFGRLFERGCLNDVHRVSMEIKGILSSSRLYLHGLHQYETVVAWR